MELTWPPIAVVHMVHFREFEAHYDIFGDGDMGMVDVIRKYVRNRFPDFEDYEEGWGRCLHGLHLIEGFGDCEGCGMGRVDCNRGCN
jgi:hypothetical protein